MAETAPIKPSESMTAEDEGAEVRLKDLVERAAAKDVVKDYNAAAELYSEAMELQAQLRGEMSLENADLLYAYGKVLYNVAVSKSDVLGSKVAGETEHQSSSTPTKESSAPASKPAESNLVRNAITNGAVENSTTAKSAKPETSENKTYFQFTGDENYDDSGSEDGGDEGQDNAEDEEEDDFANAFEVLDLARLLLHKKLTTTEQGCDKGKSSELPPSVKQIRERLADTYDLQAEISLEAERFSDAVADLRTALDLRQSLFPMEDPSVAECHYKLSLALEFDSANKGDADDSGDHGLKGTTDEDMRSEAAVHMEKAIESCRVRMAQEQTKLDTDDTLDEDKATAIRRRIANVKDIIGDMDQRLADLRRPPVSLEDQTNQDDTMLKGILGQIMGESPAQQKVRLDAVTKGANDLSAFVKRKQPNTQTPQTAPSIQKRSAGEELLEEDNKKPRIDKS
ncbi:hypothetical protein FE257_009789 [Aspergillus nanangensis]|uniref:Tetratricopeptide SHNi-TPR domain-containing protein n=1 Tax=Aspergillus nanangensis TaxID=2582783 RepID=A0AAD4GSE8_ASPNN|nr:hypothetical protein FE257_009789 [Aspergillus nanangensis]